MKLDKPTNPLPPWHKTVFYSHLLHAKLNTKKVYNKKQISNKKFENVISY